MDGNERREGRKAEKGLGGGLDRSQGIPEPAACTRGPETPFLRVLCKPRQVSFEMGPGSPRPLVPPAPSLPPQPHQAGIYGRVGSMGRTQGLLKGVGWRSMLCTQPDRPLLGIYELPGEAWNMSQRGQAKRALEGRSIQPLTREGDSVGQG